MTGRRMVGDALAELHTVLAELTQPIKRKVLRDGGRTTTHTAPSLLDQLRTATSTSGESGGGGRGSRNPIPIDPAAVDLLNSIRADVEMVHQHALASTVLGIEEHLRTIATMVTRWTNVSDVDWALSWLRHWHRAITDLIDPPQRHFLDAPCPSCGRRMASREEAGETVQVHAVLVDSHTGAECQACGTRWPPERLNLLARLIAEQARPTPPTEGMDTDADSV